MKRLANVLTVAVVLVATGGHAQDVPTLEEAQTEQPTDSAAVEAQRLFDEATKALAAGKAALGRDLLRRSLVLYSTLPTRFNLGVALRRTGEATEAVATFEGLLREQDLGPAERERIAAQLAGARAELATVSVYVTGASESTIEIDGREVGETAGNAPLVVTIDPGEHVVLARGATISRQRLKLAPGEKRDVTLHVISLAQQRASERKKVRRRRAAWISGAVGVAATTVLTTVLLTRRTEQRDFVTGDTPLMSTLRQAP